MSKFGTVKHTGAEDQRAEALAEAIELCLEPLTKLAREFGQSLHGPTTGDVVIERAEDKVALALMKLIDDVYREGYSNGSHDAEGSDEP